MEFVPTVNDESSEDDFYEVEFFEELGNLGHDVILMEDEDEYSCEDSVDDGNDERN